METETRGDPAAEIRKLRQRVAVLEGAFWGLAVAVTLHLVIHGRLP